MTRPSPESQGTLIVAIAAALAFIFGFGIGLELHSEASQASSNHGSFTPEKLHYADKTKADC